MVGGKENGKQDGGTPEPVFEGNITGFEWAAVDGDAGEKCREHAKKQDGKKQGVIQEQGGGAWGVWYFQGGFAAEGAEILRDGLDKQNDQYHRIGVVDVEHEAGAETEEKPLFESAGRPRLVPIREEESDDKRGMGVGPGGIEVHVNGKRAAPPDGDGGEQGPALLDVLAGETERKKDAEKGVEGRGESHGKAVGSGKAVGQHLRTEGAGEKDAAVSEQEKGAPEEGRAHGEMVVEMAGAGSEKGFGLTVFVEAKLAKTGVGGLIVPGEVEIVLD